MCINYLVASRFNRHLSQNVHSGIKNLQNNGNSDKLIIETNDHKVNQQKFKNYVRTKIQQNCNQYSIIL